MLTAEVAGWTSICQSFCDNYHVVRWKFAAGVKREWIPFGIWAQHFQPCNSFWLYNRLIDGRNWKFKLQWDICQQFENRRCCILLHAGVTNLTCRNGVMGCMNLCVPGIDVYVCATMVGLFRHWSWVVHRRTGFVKWLCCRGYFLVRIKRV